MATKPKYLYQWRPVRRRGEWKEDWQNSSLWFNRHMSETPSPDGRKREFRKLLILQTGSKPDGSSE